jgi:hypothetical protein
MRWLLPLLLVGCIEDRESPRADRARPQLAPVTENPAPSNTTTFKVAWEDVVTTNGCFFFSGPNGRDDQLVGTAVFQRNGSELKVTINNVVFRGTLRDDGFSVSRKSRHDYGGPWEVDETITGPRPVEGSIRATYRYTECEQGTKCPNICTIKGTIVFSR